MIAQRFLRWFPFGFAAMFASVAFCQDISELDQHFNDPGANLSPWMFVPQ